MKSMNSRNEVIRQKIISDTLEKMSDHLRNTNYQIAQINGQRIYSPVNSSGIPVPPKGTEVFVGNLPHDLFEDELVPLFSRTGPIYNVRMMLDFFGKSRGYAFICYFRPEDAQLAVTTFNNYKVRERTKMAVCMSLDNRRLFIGNIAKDKSAEEVRAALGTHVEGIVDVILYPEACDRRLNRGFAFAEFESHRLAAIARRSLSPGTLILWGQSVYVDWADPLPVVNPHVLRQVTKLFLSNLPVEISCEELRGILYKIVGPMHILKVHKTRDFAFVHFTIRKTAEEAFQKLQGLVIRQAFIKVEWARPIEYSKKFRNGRCPQHFCRSVPPNTRKMIIETVNTRNQIKEQSARNRQDSLNWMHPKVYENDPNNNLESIINGLNNILI